ncbi:hypothetical protein NM208_g3897 [Fusarium decemcellulare]|uniref:Uncharacterized protein n=1 Tax=Fusarium decemcellulare TaxID=57161 RepID=A0ACC1SMK5_9HYPO|nr:hypothetical protein NM208_g3897 [Fusarium decemcellulare]
MNNDTLDAVKNKSVSTMNNDTLDAVKNWSYGFPTRKWKGHGALIAYLIRKQFPELGFSDYSAGNISDAIDLMEPVTVPNLSKAVENGEAAAQDILDNQKDYSKEALEAYHTCQARASGQKDTVIGLQGGNSNFVGNLDTLPRSVGNRKPF